MIYGYVWMMVGSSQYGIYIPYSMECIFKDNHFYFFYWSLIAIQYRLHMYNIVIHNFKCYMPFIVIIKYWLYSLCCIIYLHFILNSFYLLLPCHCIVPPPFRSPLVTTSLFSVIFVSQPPCFLLYSLVFCIF